jgi:hypothetical protein
MSAIIRSGASFCVVRKLRQLSNRGWIVGIKPSSIWPHFTQPRTAMDARDGSSAAVYGR